MGSKEYADEGEEVRGCVTCAPHAEPLGIIRRLITTFGRKLPDDHVTAYYRSIEVLIITKMRIRKADRIPAHGMYKSTKQPSWLTYWPISN